MCQKENSLSNKSAMSLEVYHCTTEDEKAQTLKARDYKDAQCVIEIEKEVEVRKYEVDKERLIECLQSHRILSIREIAEKLSKPITLVEHWFRRDKCFAIPDPDVWFELKSMLGIETDEFDKAITTFETKPGTYDMANRIYMGDTAPTLTASSENNLYAIEGNGSRESRTPTLVATVYDWHRCDTRMTELGDVCNTASASWGAGGNNMPYVMEQSSWDGSQTAPTLTANNAGGNQRMPDKDNFNAVIQKETSQSVVRRLTPKECERLQNYPDDWTNIGDWVDSNGKKHKGDADSPRYKALGNSIALPFWQWLAERIVRQLRKDGQDHPKMASLFDGIGGFPLVFSRAGCEPVWASEIEEFPIAVTKIRFPEKGEEDGK